DSDETEPVTDTHTVAIETYPALSIDKTGDAGPVGIGETIQYTITVENTGDIALHNVTVVDAKLAFDESIAELAVGASQTFYPTYGPITENDLPGPVVNTAVADSDETEPVTDTHTVAIETYPALSIDKVGSTTSAGIGETVDYTITVTNIGDVTLTGVSVMDPMLGIVQVGGILLPGASTTVNGSYGPITENDYLNNNPLVNVAEAYSAETDPVTDTWSVDIVAAPALQIVKTGDEVVVVEEMVQYTITVTNVGDITLHNVTLSDPMLWATPQALGTLTPGQSVTLYPTYGPVTQDEYENSNPLVNTATADSDEAGPVSDDHSVIIVSKPVEPEPGLAIVKTGDAGPVAIGGYINYQIEVSNTGNITLTNVTVVDAKLGIDINLGALGVGASSVITGTYGPVTESDLPGPIVNTATADSDQTDPVSDDHSVDIVTAPGLAIDKSGSAVVKVGEYASYKIIVTNTGDVTLYGVWLEDTMLGISQSLGNLEPNESTTVLASYGPVTQDEYENSNPLVNTASALAPEQAGPVYDSHTVIIVSEPEEPTPEPPCIRSDVSVIIYGGWGNTPVRAWVGGTEHTKLFSAANSYGEQQVMWTFYPPESGTWTVSVAPELPAGADPDELSYKLIRIESPTEGWVDNSPTAASVKISRCQQYIIYYQLLHEVPPPPELPKTGASGAPLGVVSRETLFGLVGLNLLSGAYLVFRKKRR
ncbi:MAG: DUF7507 domain-containing protein, partial [Anaerolineae bacterium]